METPKSKLALVGYLKNLSTDSFPQSPWISRHGSRNTSRSSENSGRNLNRSIFSSAANSPSDSTTPLLGEKREHKLQNVSLSSIISPFSSDRILHREVQEKNKSLDSTQCFQAPPEDCTSNHATKERYENSRFAKDQIVFSISWCYEKLGAAFYDVSTSQAYVMEDKAENAPEFWVLRTLFRELQPKVILMGGRQDERLLKVINELRGVGEESPSLGGKASSFDTEKNRSNSGMKRKRNRDGGGTSSTSEEIPCSGSESILSSEGSTSTVPLCIRPASEFKYEQCRQRVMLFLWPGLTRQTPDMEREAWIRSRVDLDCIAAIRALGGLIRFLEQKGNELLTRNALFKGTPILGLHCYRMEDLVYVDEATINFLQVFSEDIHPAATKSHKASASKEGLSLFALLSRTASPLSPHVLRRVILRPMRCPEALMSRYDFLAWATQASNLDTVRQIQSCLKNVSNLQMLFRKLQRGQLSVRDWKILYKSLFNMILLAEICSSQDANIEAFREVRESTCEELYHATYLIQRTLDFDQADREGRFVVKPGLDLDLDDKKRKFSGLAEVMHKVAELELVNLPPEIDSCCIIYLPHVGYLLAIPPSSLRSDSHVTSDSTAQEDTTTFTVESFEVPGLMFMFRTADMVLFKSALCCEMDTELGDLQVDIANRETSVMIRLVEAILHQSQAFIRLSSKLLLIDVLLSFATVSREGGWVRPSINKCGSMKVKEGRHPLYEVCNPTFVSNDIIGDLKSCPVSLITGPNASGKTAYLKQVGVISYLAHLGCFVPAEEMTFSPFDAIMSVAMVTPSVTSGLSTFMVELNRLTAVISGASKHSLVLIDEFGTSTYDFDGASLLASTLNFWIVQANSESQSEAADSVPPQESESVSKFFLPDKEPAKGCPTVFASTHFYKMHFYLHRSNLVRELCLDTLQEGDKVVPLYQVVEGRTKKSFALQVAQSSGLNPLIIERARQVQEQLSPSTLPSRWERLNDAEEKRRCSEIIDMFLNFNLASDPLSGFLQSIRRHLNDTLLNNSMDSAMVNLSEKIMKFPHQHKSQGFEHSRTVPQVCQDQASLSSDGKSSIPTDSEQNHEHIRNIKGDVANGSIPTSTPAFTQITKSKLSQSLDINARSSRNSPFYGRSISSTHSFIHQFRSRFDRKTNLGRHREILVQSSPERDVHEVPQSILGSIPGHDGVNSSKGAFGKQAIGGGKYYGLLSQSFHLSSDGFVNHSVERTVRPDGKSLFNLYNDCS